MISVKVHHLEEYLSRCLEYAARSKSEILENINKKKNRYEASFFAKIFNLKYENDCEDRYNIWKIDDCIDRYKSDLSKLKYCKEEFNLSLVDIEDFKSVIPSYFFDYYRMNNEYLRASSEKE